ncbi:MAG: hypothetical protein ABIP75_02030 [Pyrinomonadaceae bacterium]
MSEIRLNIVDRDNIHSGEVHGYVAELAVAALTAEPETFAELELAMRRFLKWDEHSPFARLYPGENLEPYDAGVMVLDLAGGVIATESSCSDLEAEGQVRVEAEFADDGEVWVPFKLSQDWLIVRSIPEYERLRPERRDARLAVPPLDARAVLYGSPLVEFIAQECRAERGSTDDDRFTRIHTKWMMAPRPDLGGKTPREVLLDKKEFVDFEMHSRALQWSFAGECPPHIPVESDAYRFAGFGIHENVLYYYMVRELLEVCFDYYDPKRTINDEIEWLEGIKSTWLKMENPHFSLRTPGALIESERRRINISMSAKEILIDEDCPCCQAMAADFSTPMFWHLDGCNMDQTYEFSFHETREAYDAEQREWDEFHAKWERERKERGDEIDDVDWVAEARAIDGESVSLSDDDELPF